MNGNEFVAEATSEHGFKSAKQRAALVVLEKAGYRVDYSAPPPARAWVDSGRGRGRHGSGRGRGRLDGRQGVALRPEKR